MTKFEDVKGFVYAFVITPLITMIIAWAILRPGTYKVKEGIYTIDFLGLCKFDFYDKNVLSQITVRFRYLRFDYMKIWPFPIELPWEGEITQFWTTGPEL